MKLCICLLSFFLGIILGIAQDKPPQKRYSQGKAKLTAVILDEGTQTPLPYVNVLLKNPQGKTITGGMTSDKGRVLISDIPYGAYTLQVEFMGYQTVTKNIELTAKDTFLRLGKIFLKENIADLEEVTVVADNSTITQKIDRRVVNVGKDLTSVGTTASELLNNVPSLSVDPESGSLSMRGSGNVRVLIDGKPANVDTAILLQQIPASSIKSIEMITNPSAKYNPEGMSGILNIILHKNARSGFNGALVVGTTRGNYWRGNTSLDMNYKKDRVNFFLNYGYDKKKSDIWSYLYTVKSGSERNFKGTRDRQSHLLKAGVDINFTDKFVLEFYATQNFSKSDNVNNTVLEDKDDKKLINTDLFQDSKRNAGNYDLTLKYLFDKQGKQKIEFSNRYSKGDSPRNAAFEDNISTTDKLRNYKEILTENRSRILTNLDYTYEINDQNKLELGLEYRRDNTNNANETTQHTYLGDDGKRLPLGTTRKRDDTSFEFNRNIYSAYVNYNTQYNRFLVQAGLRFEQYNADGIFTQDTEKANYEDRIFKIYPSAFLTYELNGDNQMQVGYSLRVGRPSVRDVNPIRRWSSPKRISLGNPDLNPEFTNSFELNYNRNLKKGSFSFGGFYRNTQDNITRVNNTDKNEDEAIISTRTNMDDSHRYGLEFNGSYAITSWWRSNGSATLYVQQQKGIVDGESLSVINTQYGFRLNNSLRYSKSLRFQVSGMYRGPAQSIQSYRKSIWRLDLGGSWTVLNGKGTINLRANDIFRGFSFEFENQKPFEQNGSFNFESRTVSLGFVYIFGKKMQKKRRPKTRDGGGGDDSQGMM